MGIWVLIVGCIGFFLAGCSATKYLYSNASSDAIIGVIELLIGFFFVDVAVIFYF